LSIELFSYAHPHYHGRTELFLYALKEIAEYLQIHYLAVSKAVATETTSKKSNISGPLS
jgi:hypothetical protein